ncbi:nidogen-like domain-containing protein [Salinimonas lutimaris]|uniref:nidogen-like domain-containing protein n=1 Tax=Salinimonas lutimaris TaxID=914153 RepID=UPI0010C0AD17|nr:nidogen-like domain-containing protein [Salinimonas lutimaris]
MHLFTFRKLLLSAAVAGCTAFSAQASVLLQNWDGSTDTGFGNLLMNGNDDGSSQQIFLSDLSAGQTPEAGYNFFGTFYDSFWVNNNGNITVNGPVSGFTPNPFPSANQPMIAPFWADVDTRCGDCGEVYIGAPNAQTLVVTWHEVGYYSNNADVTNTFQLVLIDRSDTGEGNFDVEFRYEDINWTTGDLSGGVNGLGGTPAQAGYDAGDGEHFFTIPGSRTSAIADIDESPSNTDTAGIWKFAIREGELPGGTADNPLMPLIDPETPSDFRFEFSIDEEGETVFIDPFVAIGYDYIVNDGPDMTSVLLPEDIGDNVFDLWLWDDVAGQWYDTLDDIIGGEVFTFDEAVSQFRILGIEVDAMLDPEDAAAFITGLTFDGVGLVDMNQNAISQFVADNPTQVPEPKLLLLMSLIVVSISRLRRQKRS